jgi:hypothetical protein
LLATDLERALFSYGFLIAVCITFVSLYYGAGETYDAFSTVVYHFNYAVRFGDAQNVIIFATTFAFAAGFCADRNSGMIRFIIGRSNQRRYALSKCLSCSLAGGLSVMLGALLFLVFLLSQGMALLPSAAELNMHYSWQAFGRLLLGPAPWVYFVCIFFVLFLQGMFWASIGLLASGFLPNRYVAYTTPFLVSVVYSRFFYAFRLPLWMHLPRISFAYYDFNGPLRTLLVTACVFLGLCAICFVFFVRQVHRRVSND